MGMRLRQHLSRLSTVAAAALTVSTCVAESGGAAGAATSPVTSTVTSTVTTTVTGGTPATQAVLQTIGTAAQATAREFWTATRMASATPAGQARPEPASANPEGSSANPEGVSTGPEGVSTSPEGVSIESGRAATGDPEPHIFQRGSHRRRALLHDRHPGAFLYRQRRKQRHA